MSDNKSSSNKESDGKVNADSRIIVIGASTGGFEAFKKIISGLPNDFQTAIFIVWHMSPDIRGVLPHVLNRLNTIPAAHAYNHEEIKPRRNGIEPVQHVGQN